MTVNQTSAAGALAVDAQGLEQLKQLAKSDPKQAIGGVAKQFESLFLGMVMKSMRDASPQSGLFDNEQTKMFTSLLDQQLAQHIASRGTGLADVMARQLSVNSGDASATDAVDHTTFDDSMTSAHEVLARDVPLSRSTLDFAKLTALQAVAAKPKAAAVAVPAVKTPAPAAPAAVTTDSVASPAADASAATTPFAKTRDFVQRMWQHALDAATSLGVKPQFIVGQAALESGWGQHEIRDAKGGATHNLFGVKAGKDWTGPVVEKTTTEYVNGVATKTTAKFKVYSSYAESFRDYANLLRNNPRFAGVTNSGNDAAGFARGLQKAGYATDPAYANKLMRLINGPTLKQAAIDAPVQVASARIDTQA